MGFIPFLIHVFLDDLIGYLDAQNIINVPKWIELIQKYNIFHIVVINI
jgi:hypothetical protein